jgi:RimJ/RimL family protein N-acetyltransferase
MYKDSDGVFSIRKLLLEDIDSEYLSWFENHDGHLEIIVDDYNLGLKSGKWFYFLIESSEGEKIGNVKIGPIDLKNKTSDLVCLVGNRKYLGQGIAYRAIKITSDIAFKIHDIRRLHGGMYENNIPSIKAYTKAGWNIEGRMKGYYMVPGGAEDRICVFCLNPKYFPDVKGENDEG